MVLGDQDTLDAVDAMLRSRYDVKKTATLGLDSAEDSEAVFLNRILRIVSSPDGPVIEIEADT